MLGAKDKKASVVGAFIRLGIRTQKGIAKTEAVTTPQPDAKEPSPYAGVQAQRSPTDPFCPTENFGARSASPLIQDYVMRPNGVPAH